MCQNFNRTRIREHRKHSRHSTGPTKNEIKVPPQWPFKILVDRSNQNVRCLERPGKQCGVGCGVKMLSGHIIHVHEEVTM